jgi:spoIIIJ-associated protein|tara:strand:+ start:3287 stop:4081 length:795 start_codon:yes stop_codon:yes gene_type:complete
MANEWVEVEAKSIDDAIKVGLKELNLQNSTEAEINILREPEGGVFGVGGTKALVRISVRNGGKRPRNERSNRKGSRERNNYSQKKEKRQYIKEPRERREYPEADPEEQLKVSIDFLEGLLNVFGLEGKVEGKTEDKNLIVAVKGEQTEALVGDKGFILRSLHELTRTVIQRKTGAGTRLRLDVADHAVKRKEALTIYAKRLSGQILEDKQEVMLEPMSSVDRKTLHDAAAEIDGIVSYSEGREPYRSVVLAPDENAKGTSQEEE